jgi:hypothetical protein
VPILSHSVMKKVTRDNILAPEGQRRPNGASTALDDGALLQPLLLLVDCDEIHDLNRPRDPGGGKFTLAIYADAANNSAPWANIASSRSRTCIDASATFMPFTG